MANKNLADNLGLMSGLLSGYALDQALGEFIQSGRRSGASFSLVLLDLQEYRTLEQLYGGDAANHFLDTLAHKLRSRLPDGVLTGRLENGDLVVVDLDPANSSLAGTLLDTAAESLEIDGRALSPMVRAGIVFFPAHGARVETLIRRARLAASTCNNAVSSLRAYTPAMERAARKEFTLQHEMISALESGQFLLQFQPQYRLDASDMESCEALVRWRHPEHGLLMPGDLIDAAERNGGIHRLGSWVLDQACRQLAAWGTTGLGPQRVAVNVSPVELDQPGFARRVMQCIYAHGVDPTGVTLEITESVALRDPRGVPSQIRDLQSAGVQLAIDDFGAGYSSITALQHLRADHLKLDRSLTKDLAQSARARILAKSAIDLGHDLGMRVIAEGIETEAQRRVLSDLHCDAGQGYLFGRPVSPVVIQARKQQTAATNNACRNARMIHL